MKFHDLSSEDRIAMTTRAKSDLQTMVARWVPLAEENTTSWLTRTARAALVLNDAGVDGVLDLGCGTMALERMLTPGVKYVPCDVVARDGRTILCDLNREPPPRVPVQAVACLGLVSYLFNPAAVLAQLAWSYRVALVSYATADLTPDAQERRSNGWFNDYTKADLESCFTENGWVIDKIFPVPEHRQLLWLLRSRGCS